MKQPLSKGMYMLYGYVVIAITVLLVGVVGQFGDSTTPQKESTIRLLHPPSKVLQ